MLSEISRDSPGMGKSIAELGTPGEVTLQRRIWGLRWITNWICVISRRPLW